MFEHARRFRVVAALGLVLALAHGRAWGQEPIWTKAAKLVGCIWKVPQSATPKQPQAKEQHTPLFAWEKQDAAEKAFALGRACEITGDYDWAYLRYQALARRYPSRSAFATAATRANLYRFKEKEAASVCFGPSCDLHPHWRPSDFWLADLDNRAFTVPERKDMLPDSECSRTLIELGVIADASYLLQYSGARFGGGFIDSD
jgi:hypothetical protein